MPPEDLLDYHLGQLDDAARSAVEQWLASDPSEAARSERLGRALDRMLAAGRDDVPAVPAGLAARTLERVRTQGRRDAVLSFPAPVTGPGSFRWSDLAVAAAVMLAGVLSLIPAVAHARRQAIGLQCLGNLGRAGQALNEFAAMHQHYPAPKPGTPVGEYGPELVRMGALPEPWVLVCPAHPIGPELPREPDRLARLLDDPDTMPDGYRTFLQHEYAYNPGFEPDGSGVPTPISQEDRLGSLLVLASDHPPLEGPRRVAHFGNSPSHGGGGQYVLCKEGNVRWVPCRRLGPDRDIFLNDADQPGYGLHARDGVLLTPISLAP